VSGGRVDAVFELDKNVYIMEFKYRDCALDATPEEKRELFDKALDEGMRQMHEKGYYRKYLCNSQCKTIHLVSLAFLGRDNIDMRVEQLETPHSTNKI